MPASFGSADRVMAIRVRSNSPVPRRARPTRELRPMPLHPRWVLMIPLALMVSCSRAGGAGANQISDGGSGPSAPDRIFGNVTAGAGGGHTINGFVQVPDGTQTADVGTVNGSIRIGANATAREAATVNGSISLGSHASADSLSTVNGSISLNPNARVAHGIHTVNGSVTLRDGSEVDGSIANVNGTIDLSAAHVGGRITTANGDINVRGQSRVDGGILVQKERPLGWLDSWFESKHEPRVIIGPDAVVNGQLRFERQVELYVSDKATIGPVLGASPVRYSGEDPAHP